MTAVVNQLLMNAGVDRCDRVATSILYVIDFRFDWIRDDVQQSNENIIERPSIAEIFIFLELRAISHLLDQHRIMVVFSARKHGQTSVIAGTDDGLKFEENKVMRTFGLGK